VDRGLCAHSFQRVGGQGAGSGLCCRQVRRPGLREATHAALAGSAAPSRLDRGSCRLPFAQAARLVFEVACACIAHSKCCLHSL
jgi:hypothetical protein